MILDKVLILKGLGGLTALGGTAAAAYFGITSLGGDSPESLIEKVGLKCTFNGNECEITAPENGKKINVKHGETKVEEKTFTGSTSGPKIKVQKNVAASEGYNKNLKLTIEGGDIDLTNGTTTGAASGSGSTTISKLEQFETYEIVKEEGKYYLSWKRTAIDEKSKALGLPSDCNLPSSETTTCSLNAEKLKKIKFDGKQENQDITVTGTVTLKIDKTSDTTTYPGGYKFTFENTNDLSIPKTGSESISIKKGTNTEFKIKKTENKLTLEKAWTVTELAKQVGLSCTANGDKTCTLPTNNKLNLYIGSTKTENATISDSSQKIKYAEDTADHNQGFKFTADSEISLTSGTETKKIEASSGANNPSYEIKEIDGQWYLAKKTTGQAAS